MPGYSPPGSPASPRGKGRHTSHVSAPARETSGNQRSIKEWGWTTPALVGEDGGLIAGHARILAARQPGISALWRSGFVEPYGARLFGVFALAQIGFKFPFDERRIGEFGRKGRRRGRGSPRHSSFSARARP